MFYVGLISIWGAFLAGSTALLITVVHLFKKDYLVSVSAAKLAQLSFGLHTLSILSLLVMLVMEDATNAYVLSVVNSAMPTTLKMTALWGGQAGSLFFWSWTVNLCLFIALTNQKKVLDAWGFLIVSINMLFFASISLFIENPFVRVWALTDGNIVANLLRPEATAQIYAGLEGVGLNPLLRHPGMIIHPPLLYLGYGLFLVPFAVGAAQLLRSENGEDLISRTRLWLLLAWIFLTAGIVLGSWWSYDVLGWGGYWAWDPVETASLLPWLTSTALLHSLILQRQRRIFRRFNLVLVLLTYALVMFGILITRAGLISSVHAFGESAISIPLAIFTVVVFALSLGLVIWRWQKLGTGWEIQSYFTRDALFLYTNVILLGLLVVCLWGLLYPLFTGWFGDAQVVLDRTFYDSAATPLFMLLVFLMAFCPLIGWSAAALKKLGKAAWIPLVLALAGTMAAFAWLTQSWVALLSLFIVILGLANTIFLTLHDANGGHFWRRWWAQRARYGAYFVHAGVLLIALGIVGMEALSSKIEGTLIPGDKMPLGQYEVEFVGIRTEYENPEYLTVEADLVLWKNGHVLGKLQPGQNIYEARGEYISIPDKRSSLRGDFYTLLLDFNTRMGYATIQAADNRLVNFLWLGAFLMVLGAGMAASHSPYKVGDLSPYKVGDLSPYKVGDLSPKVGIGSAEDEDSSELGELPQGEGEA